MVEVHIDCGGIIQNCSRCGQALDSPDGKCPNCDGGQNVTLSNTDFLTGHSVRNISFELPPNTRLCDGRYTIEKLIGRGGFSGVYLADDAETNRKIALKIAEAGPCDNETARHQLKREFRVYTRITDLQHVLRVFDIHYEPWENTGLMLLAMEYAEGGTLRQWLLRHSDNLQARRSEGLAHFKQACLGTQAVHQSDAVHSDLKPENLLFAGGALKVSDFGAAKCLQTLQMSSTANVNHSDMRTGTPVYMSPELFAAAHPDDVDHRSDIYSLGCILYEILHPQCHAPFGGSKAELRERHLSFPPPRLPDADERYTRVVARCLEKDPARRYRDIPELLQDLDGTIPETPESTVDIVTEQRLGVELGAGIGMEMIWVPPGTFLMGSPDHEEWHVGPERQRRVTLSKGFWLGKFPVTQAQWKALLGDNPSHFHYDDHPVEQVSWHDAQRFTGKLNLRGEGLFRLPTEAEWEYACRAGTETPFGFGETILTSQANFDGLQYSYGNAGYGELRGITTPVGSYQPNALGLYDMHGNVFEWCHDWCDQDRHKPRAGNSSVDQEVDPQGPNTGWGKILRGGSFNSPPGWCRSACAASEPPETCSQTTGFRVARSE